MICFNCNNDLNFSVKEKEVNQMYHGKLLTFLTPVTCCLDCGYDDLLDKGQTDELVKRMHIQMEIDYPETEQMYQEKLSVEFKSRLKKKYEKQKQTD